MQNLVIYLLVSLLGFTAFNFCYDYGNVFTEKGFSSYGGIECTILAPLIFVMCLNVKIQDIPNTLSKLFGIISKCAFGMYLSSWMLDALVYDKLKSTVSTIYFRLNYAPITILTVIVGSFFISYFVLEIERLFDWLRASIRDYRKLR